MKHPRELHSHMRIVILGVPPDSHWEDQIKTVNINR